MSKISKCIDIHTHILRKAPEVISIYSLKSKENPVENYFSIGVHPWFIDEKNYSGQIERVENILSDKNALFIGECGLDKLKCSDFKIQQTVFQLQINLAIKYQKPMILHCVRAFDEILAMLKNKIQPGKIIFHGFHKSPELARDLTTKGYFISLGKALFMHPDKMKIIFEKVNPANIFFETDDSEYIIEQVYQKAEEISGKSIEFWKNQINLNFERINR